jgi:hypothetical protein
MAGFDAGWATCLVDVGVMRPVRLVGGASASGGGKAHGSGRRGVEPYRAWLTLRRLPLVAWRSAFLVRLSPPPLLPRVSGTQCDTTRLDVTGRGRGISARNRGISRVKKIFWRE